MMTEGQTPVIGNPVMTLDQGVPKVGRLLDKLMPGRKGGENVVGLEGGAMLEEGVPVDEALEELHREGDKAMGVYGNEPTTAELMQMSDTKFKLAWERSKQLLADPANTPDVMLKRLSEIRPGVALELPGDLAKALEQAEKSNPRAAARMRTREGLREFIADQLGYYEMSFITGVGSRRM
jgi:hypothetical protein